MTQRGRGRTKQRLALIAGEAKRRTFSTVPRKQLPVDLLAAFPWTFKKSYLRLPFLRVAHVQPKEPLKH